MTNNSRPELDDLFHQPVRLELMAELCSSADGRSFLELKERCDLTDGNLSRHLQALAQAGAVKIKKSFVDSKPLTSISVTTEGRRSFLKYLDALERVLRDAASRATGKVKGAKRQIDPDSTGLLRLKPARG